MSKKILAAVFRVDWRRIADEMRREHDLGDGHFATHEVEGIERLCAALDEWAATEARREGEAP